MIVDARGDWLDEFDAIAVMVSDAVGHDARRIDHIGSTSVPGLPAKDVIDIQVTVADEEALERSAGALTSRGWRRAEPASDHHVEGLSDEAREARRRSSTSRSGSEPPMSTCGSRGERTNGTRCSSGTTSAHIRMPLRRARS